MKKSPGHTTILIFAIGLSIFSLGARAQTKAQSTPSTNKTKVASDLYRRSQLLVERNKCEKMQMQTQKQMWAKANCFFKISAHMDAVEVLRAITEKFPRQLEAYFLASFNLWEESRREGGKDKDRRILEAEDELKRAITLNPTHWKVYVELGDFYFLRLKKPEKAYPQYLLARQYYDGDTKSQIPAASNGEKASTENRLARTTEKLDRRGEAVSASCLALHFDPDDKEALSRVERLSGSCRRKNFRAHLDPGKEEKDKK